MKNIMRTLLLALLVASSQSVSAQVSSPSQAANNFYRTYLKLNIRGLPSAEQMKVLSPLITANLKELFENAHKVQAKFIKESPDEKPPWADGDLLPVCLKGRKLSG